ncbi:MAG: F0F1 ATP synthase subunit alpha, partial [Thioalkalispiraceae bacterium]
MKQEPDRKSSIFQQIDSWLEQYEPAVRLTEVGNVVSVGDGIAWISGLPTAAMDEILLFDDGSRGVVFELTNEAIGAVLLHETDQLSAGTTVYLSHHTLDIPVGDNLTGRIIDPLG